MCLISFSFSYICMCIDQRMLGCQIPAFGVWNYCSDLPITQYFDLAMQARLLKRGANRRHRCCNAAEEEEDRGARGGGGGERRVVLFNASPSPRKPAQIKVRTGLTGASELHMATPIWSHHPLVPSLDGVVATLSLNYAGVSEEILGLPCWSCR